jgi:hypothetical protein
LKIYPKFFGKLRMNKIGRSDLTLIYRETALIAVAVVLLQAVRRQRFAGRYFARGAARRAALIVGCFANAGVARPGRIARESMLE